MRKEDAIIGISDHGGWAILVTVSGDGRMLDRRRVELVDEDLPKIPHHCEAQGLPMAAAVALVERVRASAERHAKLCLAAMATAVPERIIGVALRQCPALPPTIAECIQDYRAQNVADWVMYRKAIAEAAVDLGWAVHWFEAKKVLSKELADNAPQVRKAIGAPWGKDHQLAMAAAMAAFTQARPKTSAPDEGQPALDPQTPGKRPSRRSPNGSKP